MRSSRRKFISASSPVVSINRSKCVIRQHKTWWIEWVVITRPAHEVTLLIETHPHLNQVFGTIYRYINRSTYIFRGWLTVEKIIHMVCEIAVKYI